MRRLRRSTFGNLGLLVVVVVLGVGLAVLGVLNRRSVERTVRLAAEGRALDIGLRTRDALRAMRPRGPREVQDAVVTLTEDPVTDLAVVTARGRVVAASDVKQQRSDGSEPRIPRELAAARRGHHVLRVRSGARPVYEVWMPLRRGRPRRRFKRRRHRFPWGRAYLRVRLRVEDRATRAAVRRARLIQAVTLSAAGVLGLLAMLLFLADRRAQRLRQAMARQQVLAEMGEMAAVLAHEIRNPLGVIKGHAQLLAEKAEPAERSKLALVVEQSGRLERLVNGLLDYARPTLPDLQETDLAGLADKACELTAPEAVKADAALVRDLDAGLARVDPDQVLQVLVNLLRNAIQASPEGSTVTLTLRYRGERAVFEVKDSGPGVVDHQQDQIFKPFMTTRSGGTGLGLAVSRRIAEAHGGSLTLDSPAAGGARFVLTLPRRGAKSS